MNTKFQPRLALLFAVLFLLSASFFPQTRQTSRRPESAPFLQHVKYYEETPYVTKVVLKNGMTVLVNEYREQPVVSIQARVRAGFLDEPPQNPGLVSVLASMIRRGSPDRTSGTLLQDVQALGGFWNHSVSRDSTVYEIIAPSAQWKRALNIQADALMNPSLNQDTLKIETKLIRDQARGVLDTPSEFAEEKLLELGFDQARMGKWDYIANSGLRDIPRESLAGFHKAMYSPSRILLVISGDVSSGDLLNEVARIYDKPFPETKSLAPLSVSGAQNGFRYKGMRGNVPVPYVLFGFHTPGCSSEDYSALEVLKAIIGTGEGSVLATRLRDQKKLVLAEETKLTAAPGFGYLGIQLQVEPKNIDQSEIALLAELELLRRQEPDDAEMERALAQLERQYWKGIEDVTGRAGAYAHYELLGDWKKMDGYVAGIRKVAPSDVKRVAGKYLNLENCSILEYLPISGEERNLSSEAIKRTLESLLTSAADQEQAEREKETALALDIPQSASNFKFSELQYSFQTASILRGPDIFVREDHTVPLVDMGIFFPGGRLSETKDNAGITRLMTRLMAKGTEARGTAHFNRQLEIYGGRIQPIVADDYFGFYFTILSRNIDEGINLLLDAIKKPDFDKDNVAGFKGIQLSEIRRDKHTNALPLLLTRAALFGDFPYSIDINGTEASLAAISADSLQSWYNSQVKNRKILAVAVGDSKGTSLASYFVKQFSGSRIQAGHLPDEFAKPPDKGRQIEQDWRNSTSLIFVGFQAPPVDDEDRFAMSVLQSYAGGQGILLQKVRDLRGTAFDVQMVYEPRLRGGSAIVCAAVPPGNEKEGVDALIEGIQRIASGPIAYRDFKSAVSGSVGAYWVRRQDRLSEIQDAAIQILGGKGIEEYQAIPTNLQDVKQDELEEMAKRIFKTDKAVIVQLHGQSPANSPEGHADLRR
jgi:zinc protease